MMVFREVQSQCELHDAAGPIITISHTCKRWYCIIALDTSLWRFVNLRHVGAENMLARSKKMPLDIMLKHKSDEYYQMAPAKPVYLPWIHRYIERIESLCLRSNGDTLNSLIRSLHPEYKRLAELEIAKLFNTPGFRPLELNLPNLSQLELTSLNHVSRIQGFVLRAPNLRSLTLRGTSIELDVNQGWNLTSLAIDSLPPETALLCNPQIILGILRSSPQLRILGLQFPYFNWVEPAAESMKVHLAHIECFSLGIHHMQALEYFLAHIDIPFTAPLYHRNDHPAVLPGNNLGLGACITKQLKKRDTIEVTEFRELTLGPSYKGGFLRIFDPIRVESSNILSLSKAMTPFIDASAMRSLTLTGPINARARNPFNLGNTPSMDEWLQFLPCVPAITTIRLFRAAGWIVNLLLALSPKDTSSNQPQLCQQLKYLHIHFDGVPGGLHEEILLLIRIGKFAELMCCNGRLLEWMEITTTHDIPSEVRPVLKFATKLILNMPSAILIVRDASALNKTRIATVQQKDTVLNRPHT